MKNNSIITDLELFLGILIEYRLNNRIHGEHQKVGDAGLEQYPAVNAQFGRSVLQDQPDQAYVEGGAEHQRGQGTTLVDLADHLLILEGSLIQIFEAGNSNIA